MDSPRCSPRSLHQHKNQNHDEAVHGTLSWVHSALGGDVLFAGHFIEFQRLKLRLKQPPRWLFWGLLLSLFAFTLIFEMRTAAFQSRILHLFDRRLTYTVESGPSSRIVFPKVGPFNLQRGYVQIPEYEGRLESRGFEVAQQSRFSPTLASLSRWGITPPYREPVEAGLSIRSSRGDLIFDANSHFEYYRRYGDIPALTAGALLYMENRELATESRPPSANPVLEWDRLAKAGFTFFGRKLGLPIRLEGGSTLATQLEKYRYSPEGRTFSAGDKMRQMLSATLNVYRSGLDTREARREIVLDYLNTVPLAAVPGYGEINGLGSGLQAWFGVRLEDVDRALKSPGVTPQKVEAFKQVLTLLGAVRAPSYYLLQDRDALESRVRYYTHLLVEAGLVDHALASQLDQTRVHFASQSAFSPGAFSVRQKTLSSIRLSLSKLLGTESLYDLDRLELDARSTLDSGLQNDATRMIENLTDPVFVDAHNLRQERLLSQGDPRKLIYSLLLYEKTDRGNLLRVQADNYPEPLDINEGIKMELGSTAKLRTLAHYLTLIAELYRDPLFRDPQSVVPQDPISLWAAETLRSSPGLTLGSFLDRALDRTYSANPGEVFFTGGGAHTFENFDPNDNGRRLTIREATSRSVNLVFIRLMRDLVRFHQARLDYDPGLVLSDVHNPVRHRLLLEIADLESKQAMWVTYQKMRSSSPQDIFQQLLGRQQDNPRKLAILFFAWNTGPQDQSQDALSAWMAARGLHLSTQDIERLIRAYGNPRLTIADFGYLLNLHPLKVWVAGQLWKDPQLSWGQLWEHSPEARKEASAWLFQTRNRHAQDLRLRIRFEQDAFARMTPYWQKLGFPFDHLVPSLATAIGSSSDRPAALAELMGIIVNEGRLQPTIRFEELQFAPNTPYHTVLVPKVAQGVRAMPAEVATTIREVLAGVVSDGTARRLSHAFVTRDGEPVVAGGKTGSGDNRYKTFSRGGGLIAAHPVNRTAAFVFYIDDRYFGVITALVLGKDAGGYHFTSALPVTVLKLLAPAINRHLAEQELARRSIQPGTAASAVLRPATQRKQG